jgi:hypothetical protein
VSVPSTAHKPVVVVTSLLGASCTCPNDIVRYDSLWIFIYCSGLGVRVLFSVFKPVVVVTSLLRASSTCQNDIVRYHSLWIFMYCSRLYSSPSIIRMIKSRRMRFRGHVARMADKRDAYRLLAGKPEGKRPLGRPRRW